jgi:hypothetical protein
MKVTAQFFYGPSYANPDGTDVEQFDSIAAVGRMLQSRADFDPYYPCVENAEALVWKGHLEDVTDLDPDMSIVLGPKGGIRRDNV